MQTVWILLLKLMKVYCVIKVAIITKKLKKYSLMLIGHSHDRSGSENARNPTGIKLIVDKYVSTIVDKYLILMIKNRTQNLWKLLLCHIMTVITIKKWLGN